MNEAGELLFYYWPPKCCDTRSALQALEFIDFRSNTVSSFDCIRLFLAAQTGSRTNAGLRNAQSRLRRDATFRLVNLAFGR